MEVSYVDFPSQFRFSRQRTLEAIGAVFERGDFIQGLEVQLFEEEFARLCGVKHAIAVANGTDSLILGMRALGIGRGDEVITAPNSWISSASSIALVGATPVFADVDADQNISPAAIKKAITQRTKAIMPVHLTGRLARMDEISEIGLQTGIPILEDAAQAVMAKRGSFVSGACGLMGSFSLHPLKNLNAAGDAGIVTTNDDQLAPTLRLLRSHGLKNRDEVEFWGYNSRLDTIQAAVLRLRLKELPAVSEPRRATAAFYNENLKDCCRVPTETAGEFHTYHVYVIQTPKRDALKKYLEENGIQTKIHYPIPIHLQNAAKYLGHKAGDFPVTEAQANQILSLPVHQFLSQEQKEYVVQCIQKFFSNA